MRKFGVTSDYDYSADHKRDRLDIWEGPWYHSWAGEAYSLKDGYMITDYNGRKIRVTCPVPRDESNYIEVDKAINAAMVKLLDRAAL